ncbi:hypothetical protein AKG34_21400 [Peribacillus butanolivorans]|uniref:recombinase family protein n=1 Tax=Peribacillus butanolivorans TaxID=421767 RepID=UPI0006A6C590|nr:recombinase family protein [Peribacillus butanolivorans]KON67378.1 hypothetical protein AKG34_21400 [Peribacillus butanolivorans]
MIVGYARISDKSQNIGSQVDQLKKFGCEKIIQETITGIAEDKELNKLVDELKEGDTLVATRTDRISRSAIQFLMLANKLEEKSVFLVLTELGVDARTPAGKMILGIMASLGQWERESLKEKQKRGIEAARKRGIHLGRPKKFTNSGLETAIEMYEKKEKTISEICAATQVSRATLYRKLKEREIK